MSKLPKLKVEYTVGEAHEERTCDFEEARKFLYGSNGGEYLVTVEGQGVISYDEFVQRASQDEYKDKEFLKVKLTTLIVAGG
ncbi:hypothetical protein ACFLTK_02165 [Chloroflexota bacterium]